MKCALHPQLLFDAFLVPKAQEHCQKDCLLQCGHKWQEVSLGQKYWSYQLVPWQVVNWGNKVIVPGTKAGKRKGSTQMLSHPGMLRAALPSTHKLPGEP